jgi:hypothetical protein
MTVAEFSQRWAANGDRSLARGILQGPSATFARQWHLWTLSFIGAIVVTVLITWKGWSLTRFGMALPLYLACGFGAYLIWSPWLAARRRGLCAQQLRAIERHLGRDPSEAKDFVPALKIISSPFSGESEATRRHAGQLYRLALGQGAHSFPVVSSSPQSEIEALPVPGGPTSDPA